MKKIVLFFIILMLSCDSNKIELENIEIMGYYYKSDILSNSFKPDTFIYSLIDSVGFSKNLRKIDSVDVIGYSFIVDKTLIKKITKETYSKDENYFIIKPTSEIVIDDGSIFRIKVSYTNGKTISFIIPNSNHDKNSKFFIYENLLKELINNPKTELYKINELNALKFKQNEFAKYAIHKDTLLLPMPSIMPPAPKLDEVKFVKPEE